MSQNSSQDDGSNASDSELYEEPYPLFITAKDAEASKIQDYVKKLVEAVEQEESGTVEINSDAKSPNPSDYTNATDSSSGSLYPFRGWTREQAWDFFKAHLRPPPDGSGAQGKTFANFVCLVADDECIASGPPQVIVVTDGPDENDATPDEVNVRSFCREIEEAVSELACLETLTSTPSEVIEQKSMRMSVQPPPILAGPPEAMRKAKATAIYGIPP